MYGYECVYVHIISYGCSLHGWMYYDMLSYHTTPFHMLSYHTTPYLYLSIHYYLCFCVHLFFISYLHAWLSCVVYHHHTQHLLSITSCLIVVLIVHIPFLYIHATFVCVCVHQVHTTWVALVHQWNWNMTHIVIDDSLIVRVVAIDYLQD